jgi:hypothetical protein
MEPQRVQSNTDIVELLQKTSVFGRTDHRLQTILLDSRLYACTTNRQQRRTGKKTDSHKTHNELGVAKAKVIAHVGKELRRILVQELQLLLRDAITP